MTIDVLQTKPGVRSRGAAMESHGFAFTHSRAGHQPLDQPRVRFSQHNHLGVRRWLRTLGKCAPLSPQVTLFPH